MKERVSTPSFKTYGLGHFWLLKSWVLVPFDCRILKGSLTPIRWMAKPWKDTSLDYYPCILCKYFLLFLFCLYFHFWFWFDWSVFCVFETYAYLCTEPFRLRPWENFFTEITSERLYEHQWYISKNDIYVGKFCCLKEVY